MGKNNNFKSNRVHNRNRKHNARKDADALPDISAIIRAIPIKAEIMDDQPVEGPSEENFVIITRQEYARLIERSTRLSVLTNLQNVHFPDGDPRFRNLRSEGMAAVPGGGGKG